jgi:Tfp pilus assembly protein PilO
VAASTAQSALARIPFYAKLGLGAAMSALTVAAYWFVFYLALREQRARELNKVLPPDAEEDAFLSSVQQASNAAGIDLKGFAPQDEVTQSFYAKVPMKLEVTGRFHQIAKFAYELGKIDRIINVEDIELTDQKVVGDEVILKGKVLATAFHAKLPTEPARGAAGAGAPSPTPAPSEATPPTPEPGAGGAR